MAMGMGPQAGHDVFLTVPDDESCCTFGQCTITYYVFFAVLSAMACVFALMVLFSGLQWMGWLVTDLVILAILWATFCCVYGCWGRRKFSPPQQSGTHPSDPAVGVQLAYPAGAPAGVNVQQGYPVTGVVYQGYPVTHPAPAPSWPTPSVPPGPKVPYQGPYGDSYPQSQASSSS
ncbi:hypothetical protein R1flu_004035 [Riccia fluitans]|uniref:Uncharacterized protein n=1 Tax=Riccia fluitans TaxID=41844 RepID=A0ABD1YPP3_9MARC